MPRHKRLLTAKSALITVVCSGLVFLAGCSSAGGSEAAPSPTPSATHFFESEAQAIAAGQRLLADLFDLSASSAKSGDTSALQALLGTELYELESAAVLRLHDAGVSISGLAVDSNFVAESVTDSGVEAVVEMSFCRDVTSVRMLLTEGGDVTPPDRPERQSLIARMEFDKNGQRLVALDSWTKKDACDVR